VSFGAEVISDVSAGDPIEKLSVSVLASDSPTSIRTEPIHLYEGEYERDGAVTVQHFLSKYDEGWEHDFGICGTAACSGTPTGYLFGNKYKVEVDTGSLQAYVNGYQGINPADGDGYIPDWVEPFIGPAVDLLSTPTSWMTSGMQSLREHFVPDEGYEFTGDGLKYTNVMAWGAWNAAHYHRFEWETGEKEYPRANIKSAFGEGHTPWGDTHWVSANFDVSVGDPEPPDCNPNVEPCPTPNDYNWGIHPEEMTQSARRAFGIKKVDKGILRSQGVMDQLRTSSGNLPEYVATKSPLSVTDVSHERSPLSIPDESQKKHWTDEKSQKGTR